MSSYIPTTIHPFIYTSIHRYIHTSMHTYLVPKLAARGGSRTEPDPSPDRWNADLSCVTIPTGAPRLFIPHARIEKPRRAPSPRFPPAWIHLKITSAAVNNGSFEGGNIAI